MTDLYSLMISDETISACVQLMTNMSNAVTGRLLRAHDVDIAYLVRHRHQHQHRQGCYDSIPFEEHLTLGDLTLCIL